MRITAILGLASCLVLGAAMAHPASAASLLVNGDFESGPVVNPSGYTTVLGGDSISIPGWTVLGNSVDYIGNYWQPESGTHSIDLSGNAPGGLSQSFATTIGQRYDVAFWYAGNPDSSANKTGTATVSAAGGITVNLFYPQFIGTKANMVWLPMTYSFVATAATTTLTFLSTTGTAFGLALDNVSVSAVPLPGALLLFGTALAGFGVFGRRRRAMNLIPA